MFGTALLTQPLALSNLQHEVLIQQDTYVQSVCKPKSVQNPVDKLTWGWEKGTIITLL